MRYLISLFLIVLSAPSIAIQPLSSELTQVATVWYGEGVIMRFKDTLTYTEGSETCSGRAIMLPHTEQNPNPLFKENLSLLLSAFHTGTKVTISVDGCEGNNMRVISVSIDK